MVCKPGILCQGERCANNEIAPALFSTGCFNILKLKCWCLSSWLGPKPHFVVAQNSPILLQKEQILNFTCIL